MKNPHLSVMEKEFLHFFEGKKITIFFEGTVGAGGHARAMLEAHPEITTYLACDRDPEALKIAKKNLEPWGDKVQLIQGNFADLHLFLEERKIDKVDGFFLISEYHLCN